MNEIINGMVGGGIATLLVAVIGFIFREKWKQILQRSLVQDMEQIKHDFQQKLEAYKVTLIAEAEAAKAKQELKKSIALRYAEIEFERLVELEKLFSHIPTDVASATQTAIEYKTEGQTARLVEQLTETMRASERAGMFLSVDMKRKIRNFLRTLFLVPLYAGVEYCQLRREELWGKYYTDAPPRQRRCVERYNIVKRV